MSTKKVIESGTSVTRTAMVLARHESNAIEPTSTGDGAVPNLEDQFASLCDEAKRIQTRLCAFVARNVLNMARVIYQAKLVYEKLTGTGHGKRTKNGLLSFDKEIAKRTGVHNTLVQKFCQIGKMKPETANLIDGTKLAGNLTALVRIAQAEALTSLNERIAAVSAFEDGGRKSMEEVLDTAAPKKPKTKKGASSEKSGSMTLVASPTDDTPTTGGSTMEGTPLATPPPAPEAEVEPKAVAKDTTPPAPVPVAKEEVLIPIVGGIGRYVFLGADVWVKVIPATGRKGGIAVWLSNREPGAPEKRAPESPDTKNVEELMELVDKQSASAAE
jgi:hypothetical protein